MISTVSRGVRRAAPWVSLLIATLASGYWLGRVDGATKPKAAELLRTVIAGTKGKEVLVSRLELPAGFAIPRHYHPGEEIIHLLEGSASVTIAGKPARQLRAGDTFYIPYKKIHWGIGGNGPAVALIFRVHDRGKPIRIPVK